MTGIGIRRIQPSDSLEELTSLLRRAFSVLGRQGLDCTCVDQTVAVTRQRVGLGDCFVAVADRRVVGTITLHGVDRASAVNWYRNPAVASMHQFAVDPSHQGTGVGRALLRTAEDWARSRRCLQLALDTPEPAEHLRAFYGRRGFLPAERTRILGKSYFSVVLSKAVNPPARPSRSVRWPARHPAEMALLARTAATAMQQVHLPRYQDCGALDSSLR